MVRSPIHHSVRSSAANEEEQVAVALTRTLDSHVAKPRALIAPVRLSSEYGIPSASCSVIDLLTYSELDADGAKSRCCWIPAEPDGGRPRADEHGVDDQGPSAAADS
jgi:hypothetical protein